jgi:hypothetical protein
VNPEKPFSQRQIFGVASLQMYPLSTAQVAEHPSPNATFPSSHASAESFVPSPQELMRHTEKSKDLILITQKVSLKVSK